jgi:hypothetical protein
MCRCSISLTAALTTCRLAVQRDRVWPSHPAPLPLPSTALGQPSCKASEQHRTVKCQATCAFKTHSNLDKCRLSMLSSSYITGFRQPCPSPGKIQPPGCGSLTDPHLRTLNLMSKRLSNNCGYSCSIWVHKPQLTGRIEDSPGGEYERLPMDWTLHPTSSSDDDG